MSSIKVTEMKLQCYANTMYPEIMSRDLSQRITSAKQNAYERVERIMNILNEQELITCSYNQRYKQTLPDKAIITVVPKQDMQTVQVTIDIRHKDENTKNTFVVSSEMNERGTKFMTFALRIFRKDNECKSFCKDELEDAKKYVSKDFLAYAQSFAQLI